MLLPAVTLLVATALPIATPVAQQVPRIHISPNGGNALGFNWNGKSEDGSDHQVPVYRIIIRYTNPLLPASQREVIYDSLTEVDNTGALTKIPIADALRGVPSGDWDAQLALEDVAGDRGKFSVVTDKTRFTVSTSPPSAPTNAGVVDA